MTDSVAPLPQIGAARHNLALYALIGCMPFAEFVQTGVFAFNSAPVMGAIGASPEEYSLVATLYAVVAIGMISHHRWMMERLGWRLFIQLSCALFGLGAVVCGLSDSLGGFVMGRTLMAAGGASFMTAGRMLVNNIPPSPRRFNGIRCFATGLAAGAAAGPVLAAMAISAGSWRGSFFALAPLAVIIGLLATFELQDIILAPRERTQSHFTGLLLLMGGAFVLLHALQRSAFDFFSVPLAVIGAAAAALAALVLFVHLDRLRTSPLIRFGDLAQRRYLMGLAVFCTCYLILGADNYVLGVLLQKAMGVALEPTGRYLSLGSLAGLASWAVMSRLLPRWPGPSRYYVAGFTLLFAFGCLLSRLSEEANVLHHVIPALLCHGAFVIVVLSTTAMQTFQTLQRDPTTFSHANQVKNMLSQFGIAAGMALATLCMQWRSTLHYARLSESLSATNLTLQATLATLTQYFASLHDPATASRMALAQLGQMVTQEATLMAALDYFYALSLFAALCVGLVLLEQRVRAGLQRKNALLR